MNKFLRQLQMINMIVEMAKNDLPMIHDTFHKKYDVKVVLRPSKFMYHHCISITMRSSCYVVHKAS